MLGHTIRVLLVTVVGCYRVASAFGAVTLPEQAEPENAAVATPPFDLERAATVRTAPAKAVPHAARRLVFSCFAPGVVIFSDRPCGPAAATRELRVDAPAAQSGRGASVAPEPGRVSMRLAPDRSAVDETAVGADTKPGTCQRLREAVDALDAHMRNGYSAREAGRLWDRWREARSRLREARC